MVNLDLCPSWFVICDADDESVLISKKNFRQRKLCVSVTFRGFLVLILLIKKLKIRIQRQKLLIMGQRSWITQYVCSFHSHTIDFLHKNVMLLRFVKTFVVRPDFHERFCFPEISTNYRYTQTRNTNSFRLYIHQSTNTSTNFNTRFLLNETNVDFPRFSCSFCLLSSESRSKLCFKSFPLLNDLIKSCHSMNWFRAIYLLYSLSFFFWLDSFVVSFGSSFLGCFHFHWVFRLCQMLIESCVVCVYDGHSMSVSLWHRYNTFVLLMVPMGEGKRLVCHRDQCCNIR